VIERLAYFIATVGFVGRFPIAPGTAGSVAGLFVYSLIRFVDGPRLEAAMLVITLVVGTWAANVAERFLGGKDPGPVVVDEVLGMLITLAFLDVNVAGAILGFLLFRIADVVKPFPSNRFEALPGGLGVMMDDAMAAVYSHVVLRVLVMLLPGWFD
jgi:phosphatidylglycerophosphatase A